MSETPKIELYMYSLNQEFPAGKGHTTFLKRHSELRKDIVRGLTVAEDIESQIYKVGQEIANDWPAQWLSNEWVTNHDKIIGAGYREETDPLMRAVIREEDFGAIVLDPISDRVYKLNPAGAKLFREIVESYRKNDRSLKGFKATSVKAEKAEPFLEFLKGSGLWIGP